MIENLAMKLKTIVLGEYEAAMQLSFPMFPITVNNKVIDEPNLMQRTVVASLMQKRTLGNWSDMGTGKTLATVLGAYSVKSKFTIVCCPNSVTEEWISHIIGVFPNAVICESIRKIDLKTDFLIVNYEQFQQGWSKRAVDKLVREHRIDLLVFDEIHQVKQRDENISKRRSIIMHLRKRAEKVNKNIYVIGQTGTPCINETLREPISQLELISGKEHGDLPTKVSINNIYRVRQPLILAGIRCPSSFNQRKAPKIVKIDCTHRLDDIIKARHSLLALDQILLDEKIPFILKQLNHKDKTIIYVHFVKNLVVKLQNALECAGYSVDTYTGMDTAYTRNKVKKNFVNGDTEVLIASQPISTGVDGLQKVCHKIIPAILPWTATEYRQLICRLERFGQENSVDILIPQTFINTHVGSWSLDEVRWNRILHKQSIGDMLTDGVVPDEVQLSLKQVKTACLKWLNRVESGKIYDQERQDIVVEFNGDEDTGRNSNYSKLTQIHIRLNKMHSKKTSEYFKDSKNFYEYHRSYKKESNSWEVIPREVLVKYCQKGDVVGDFGCGDQSYVAKLLPDCKVYSFDHNSLNDESVICCDIANVPLEDSQLDVAIFSLSLMGCNYKDYLEEAHRCLRTGGKICIADLTNHRLVRTLLDDLQEIGFHGISEIRKSKFTFIKAVKK